MMNLMELRDVTLIQGRSSGAALALVDRGADREEVRRETGDVVLLSGINLDIRKHEFSALAGPDKQGKSALLRTMNGLNAATRGQIVLDDDGEPVDISHCSRGILRRLRAQRIVMVDRDASLLPQLTLRENCKLGLTFQELAEDVAEQRVQSTMEELGILEDGALYPQDTDDRTQRLTAIARALVMQPDLLLMDDPLHPFDLATQSHIISLIRETCDHFNPAFLWVTEHLETMMGVADQISIMIEGRIRQTDSPVRLLARPAGKDVRQQIERLNLLDVLSAGTILTPLSRLPRDPKDPSRIFLDALGQVRILLNEEKEPVSASDGMQSLEGVPYDDTMDIALLAPETLVAVTEDISLRILLELQVKNPRPTPVINGDGQMIGAVMPRDLQQALLGIIPEQRPQQQIAAPQRPQTATGS